MALTDHFLKLIQSESISAFETIRKIRRDLHAHPELSGNESWTSDYLAESVASYGFKVQKINDGHGLIANLVNDPSKPTMALRVDIDALPIDEINDVPYRSKIPGVMHACGHDVHSAIGIGTAAVLARLSFQIPGNVRIIFQPEEEEIRGALRMIHAGALNNPKPIAIFGLHVAPLPAGQIAWTNDLFLAGFDHYLATLAPKEGSQKSYGDLDGVAKRCCHIIRGFNQWHLPETWQEMQSFWELLVQPPDSLRNFTIYDASLDQENPAAWVGQFGIGIKAANPHLRRFALGRIRAALNRISSVNQVNYYIEPVGSMIDMRNDPELVRSTLPTLERALGAEKLINLAAAFPFNCEDFAYYTKEVPGAMLWLGSANPDQGKYALLHTPDFDVDETCLITGTTAMAALLTDVLYQHSAITTS